MWNKIPKWGQWTVSIFILLVVLGIGAALNDQSDTIAAIKQERDDAQAELAEVKQTKRERVTDIIGYAFAEGYSPCEVVQYAQNQGLGFVVKSVIIDGFAQSERDWWRNQDIPLDMVANEIIERCQGPTL